MANIEPWKLALEDLAGNNQSFRVQIREVCSWFPSAKLLLSHARGLAKQLTDGERARAFPRGHAQVPLPSFLVWAMQEATLNVDPYQRARWWMYRSTTSLAPVPLDGDPADAFGVVVVMPAPVDPAEYASDGDLIEMVFISDDDTNEVVIVAPAAVEGGRNMPIDVELLPEELKVEEEEQVKETEQNKKGAVKKVRRSIRLQQLKK